MAHYYINNAYDKNQKRQIKILLNFTFEKNLAAMNNFLKTSHRRGQSPQPEGTLTFKINFNDKYKTKLVSLKVLLGQI